MGISILFSKCIYKLIEANTIQQVFFSLALLGVSYNAFLALINSLVFQVNTGLVVISEISVLGVGLAYFLSQYKLREKDKYVVFLFLSISFSLLLIFISTQIFFVDGIRNFLIICVFFLIGSRLTSETLHNLFFTMSVVIAFFLVLEITMLDVYVKLFEPALYYQNTRGIDVFEFDTTGVFGNALGFDGRFSYGVFNGPRTSSIFLEQVGLANFAIVISIYLLTFEPFFGLKIKIFYLCFVVLICLSNETRVGSFLVFTFFVIGLFRSKIPPFVNLMLPIITIISGFYVTGFYGEVQGDDLLGRINVGFQHLQHLETIEYFGTGILKINELWDSGFGYLIATSTIVGSTGFIFFVLFIIKQLTTEGILCALGLSMYIFMNLAVSGNAIYSIKTATLLWVLVGFVYNTELKRINF
jgi:hypothetical protein